MFESFTQQEIPIEKSIKMLEEENNSIISLYLAKLKLIPCNSIYKPKYNQKIISVGYEGQDLLYTIEPTSTQEIERIWMDQMLNGDDYEEIGDRIINHCQIMQVFIDNVNHAITCEVQANGSLESDCLDKIYEGVKNITAFELEEFQEYINTDKPTETFEFMGLHL